MSRTLVVKRNPNATNQPLMLCDEATGEFLAGQLGVELVQVPGSVAKVIVTFVAKPKGSDSPIHGVKIQVDD